MSSIIIPRKWQTQPQFISKVDPSFQIKRLWTFSAAPNNDWITGTQINSTSGVSFVGSSDGIAAELAGTTAYYRTGYGLNGELNLTGSGSLLVRCYLASGTAYNDNTDRLLLDLRPNGATAFMIDKYSDNKFYAGLYVSGTENYRVSGVSANASTFPTNSWINFILTWSPANKVKLYAGRTLVGTSNSAIVTNYTFTNGIALGNLANATTSGLSAGSKISLAAHFGVELSHQQVLSLVDNPWQIFRKQPQILYFDVGGGATTYTHTASLTAAIQQARTATASLAAAIQQSNTATASADAAIQQARSASATIAAAILANRTDTATLDAAILQARTAAASLDALVTAAGTNTQIASLDAAIRQARSATASLAAAVQAPHSATASISAAVAAAFTVSASLTAAIRLAATAQAGLDAYIEVPGAHIATASLNAAVQAAQIRTASLSAAIQQARSAVVSLDTAIGIQHTATASLDGWINAGNLITASLDAAVRASHNLTASLNGYILTDAGEATAFTGCRIYRVEAENRLCAVDPENRILPIKRGCP